MGAAALWTRARRHSALSPLRSGLPLVPSAGLRSGEHRHRRPELSRDFAEKRTRLGSPIDPACPDSARVGVLELAVTSWPAGVRLYAMAFTNDDLSQMSTPSVLAAYFASRLC